MNTIPLAGGGRLPAVGLGQWKVPNPAAAGLVAEAIRVGYRHLDAACDYGNEREVGDGIRAALAAGHCRRDDLWVTSKLWNTYHAPGHVVEALDRTLADLRLDYLDLFLIHFPIAQEFVPFETRYPPGWFFDPADPAGGMRFARVPLVDTWSALEDLQIAGKVKHIGLCNVGTAQIRDILAGCCVRPAVLQVELHPYLTQEKLVRFCREEGVAVTAFSPLGAPSYVPLGMAKSDESVMEEPVVKAAAARLGKTPAQVLLRWGVQRGTAVVPKTARVERLAENLAVFDFALSEKEMAAISALNRNRRFNDPGDFAEAAFRTFCPIYE